MNANETSRQKPQEHRQLVIIGNVEPIHVMDELRDEARRAGVPTISTSDIKPRRGRAFPLERSPSVIIGDAEPIHVMDEFVERQRRAGAYVISTGDIKPLKLPPRA